VADFQRFYLEYMGADREMLQQGQSVFPSIHRVEPESSLSYVYHHLIVSLFEDRLVHSIAPALFPDYREIAPTGEFEGLLQTVDDAFASVYRGKFYRIRSMLRYSTGNIYPPDPSIRALTQEDRDMAMDRMRDRGSIVREKFWQNTLLPMIRQGRVLSAIVDGTEVSRSNVTDLPCGAANIDIWTHPGYRGKGFGKAVVRQAVNWCLLNGKVPVYVVSPENKPSLRLAESIGLVRKTTEIQTVVIRY
jgi:RimJ/RimL family protein N-acetyltransferase